MFPSRPSPEPAAKPPPPAIAASLPPLGSAQVTPLFPPDRDAHRPAGVGRRPLETLVGVESVLLSRESAVHAVVGAPLALARNPLRVVGRSARGAGDQVRHGPGIGQVLDQPLIVAALDAVEGV